MQGWNCTKNVFQNITVWALACYTTGIDNNSFINNTFVSAGWSGPLGPKYVARLSNIYLYTRVEAPKALASLYCVLTYADEIFGALRTVRHGRYAPGLPHDCELRDNLQRHSVEELSAADREVMQRAGPRAATAATDF